MRKHVIALILGAIGSLFLMVAPAVAQTRSVFWERWDVVIDNVDTTSNRFTVQEIYDVYFTGQFTFGSAVIPNTNLESITSIQVYEAGVLLRAGCSQSPGTYCVQSVREGTSITYYFSRPIKDARQQFTISYTVNGALRVYEGGDQIWWTAIPSEHFGFSIGSSTITVVMPDGFVPREGIDPVETYGAPSTIRVAGNTITATATRQIGGSERFEIRAQFPHNPNARVPAWQADFDSRRQFEETVKPLIDLGLIGISLLLALGGPLLVFGIWYTRGRDPKVGPVPRFLSELPSNLPPAVVGTLVDEKADLRDVLSTVVDLARRGYIVFEEDRTQGLIFGIGAKTTFTFKRTDKALNDLRPFEKKIISKVFGKNLERTLDSLKNKFYQYIPQLQDDLYDELVKQELFTSKPSTTRSFWGAIGGGTFFAAAVLGFLLFDQIEKISGLLLCLPASLGVAGAVAGLVGQYMPAKTRKGAEEAAKWRAFREYLVNLEKYQNVEEASANFDAYLPYAVAFGLDRSWIRKFSKVQSLDVPVWYYPTYRGGYYSGGYRAGTPISGPGGGLPSAKDVMPGDLARAGGSGGLNDMASSIGGGLESISSGLTSMLESTSRVLTSRPQSSGSSGKWGGGGSSWSGGGFSGGGGSGGGSRGFG